MIHDDLHVEDRMAAGVGKGFADGISIDANVHLVLRGPDGRIKDERRVHNQVQTAGKAHIADQLSAVPGEAAMSHMAVGTGSGQGVGDATLLAEIDRNALTSRTDAGAVVTYVGTWVPGDATNALTEAGIFNNAAGGTMLVYADFLVINKGALDSLVMTWTLTIN